MIKLTDFRLNIQQMRNKLFPVLFILFSSSVFAQSDQEQLLFNVGEQYFSSKEFDKSLEIFTELHNKNPTNQIYFDRYWRSLFETGKYDEAHSNLEQEFLRTQADGLLLEMAKISVISNQEERAKSEWNKLLNKYPNNISIARTVAASMIQLKKYDLAKELYLSRRTEKMPTVFSQELINLFTLTFDVENAAKEFLNILSEQGVSDGYIESRINQYFSDSLSSAKMLSVFSKLNPEKYNASIYRLIGNLYKNTGNFSGAFASNLKYDILTKTDGNATFSFFLSASDEVDPDSLLTYLNQFRQSFPASRFLGNLELKTGQIWFLNLERKPDFFFQIEKFYLAHESKPDFNSFADLYLKSILKSSWSIQEKSSKISLIVKTKKLSNSDYWNWVVSILNEKYDDAKTMFAKPEMKSTYKWEFIQTSLATGFPIDSLRWQLLTYSSDLKSKTVPKYLYLLIQSVPLPNINFSDYVSFAKATVQQQIYQTGKSEFYFKEVSKNSADMSLKILAESELLSIWISQENNQEIDSLYSLLDSKNQMISKYDEVLYQLGSYYNNHSNFNTAKKCFELLIENSPASPFLSLARNQLNEIRKKLSS